MENTTIKLKYISETNLNIISRFLEHPENYCHFENRSFTQPGLLPKYNTKELGYNVEFVDRVAVCNCCDQCNEDPIGIWHKNDCVFTVIKQVNNC
jgi:hypothetical protein